MRRFLSCSRGATTIELGLFAVLAVILINSGVSTVGEKFGGTFAQAGAAMASSPPQTSAVQAEIAATRTEESLEVENTTWNLMEHHRDQ